MPTDYSSLFGEPTGQTAQAAAPADYSSLYPQEPEAEKLVAGPQQLDYGSLYPPEQESAPPPPRTDYSSLLEPKVPGGGVPILPVSEHPGDVAATRAAMGGIPQQRPVEPKGLRSTTMAQWDFGNKDWNLTDKIWRSPDEQTARKMLNEREALYQSQPDLTHRTWFARNVWYPTVQSVVGQVRSAVEPSTLALAGAGAGVGTAIPGYGTVAGAKAGLTIGQAKEWYEYGAGDTLADLLKSGVEYNLARRISVPAGLLYSAIEFIFNVIPLPRMPQFLGASNPAIRSSLRATSRAMAKQYAKGVLAESTEESLQSLTQDMAHNLAAELQKNGVPVPKLATSTVLMKAVNSFIQAVGPSALMIAPGQVSDVRNTVAISKQMKSMGLSDGQTTSYNSKEKRWEVKNVDGNVIGVGEKGRGPTSAIADAIIRPEVIEPEAATPAAPTPPAPAPEAPAPEAATTPPLEPQPPAPQEAANAYPYGTEIAPTGEQAQGLERGAEGQVRVRDIAEAGVEAQPGEAVAAQTKPPSGIPAPPIGERRPAGLATVAVGEGASKELIQRELARYDRNISKREIATREAERQMPTEQEARVFLLDLASKKLRLESDVGIAGLHRAMILAGNNMLATGDPKAVELVADATREAYSQITEEARSISMLANYTTDTPENRRQMLAKLAAELPQDIAKMPKESADYKARKTAHYAAVADAIKQLMAEGMNPAQMADADIMDNKKFIAAWDRIMATKTSGVSKVASAAYEWWVSSILMGIPTNVANFFGNLVNATLELGIQRRMEALVNKIAKVPGAPTTQSVAAMMGALKQNRFEAIRRGLVAMREAWRTEVPAIGPQGRMKWEHRGRAIPGWPGRLIRWPLRALLAADELAKTSLLPALATEHAHRLYDINQASANKTALTRSQFVDAEVADQRSDAWALAYKDALDLTFQERPPALAQSLMRAREAGGITGLLLKFIVPFITTPTNILMWGLRKSPVGIIGVASDIMRGKYKGDAGKIRLLNRATEQALAWGAFAALWGLSGRGDDDEPWITGSPQATKSVGERRFRQQHLPPHSVKIGGKWLDYGRLEPISTILQNAVDAVNNIRATLAGKQTNWSGQAIANLRDKTFLMALGDIISIMEDPGGEKGQRWLQKFAVSWWPNIFRTTLRATDPYLRDPTIRGAEGRGAEHLKRVWQGWFPLASIAPPPRIDIWGNPISMKAFWPFATDFLWRATVPLRLQNAHTMNNIDRMIFNWNSQHAGEDVVWWPTLPPAEYSLRGKTYRMTEQQYETFLRRRGKYAWDFLQHRNFSYANPSESDIRAVEEAFSRAGHRARTQTILEARTNETPSQ